MAEKKQNESKFMAMLERRGIVRKVDSEDASAEDSTRLRADADLRSLLDMSTDSSADKRTPPQPVPGMSKPVFPADKPASSQSPKPAQVSQTSQTWSAMPTELKRQTSETPKASTPLQSQPQVNNQPQQKPQAIPEPIAPLTRENAPVQSAGFREQASRAAAAEPVIPAPAPAPLAATPKPRKFFSHVTADLEPALPDEKPYTPVASETPLAWPAPERPPEPPVENHTERFLDINELYEVLSLKSSRTDTIYLIEEYLQTLPDSLPEDAKRDIISKIVAASGFDYDLLMGDGVLRVRMLREYAERFAHHTEDYIAARQSELDDLDRQIIAVRKLIDKRRELHKKQFLVIEAEAQRLKDVLAFIAR